MPLTPFRRLVIATLVCCASAAIAVVAVAFPAAAHNTLVSSDPADGVTLDRAPTQITWVFDRTVPLDSMTVILIDQAGARTDLEGSTYGPAGDAEIVTPLPNLPDGEVTLRWRLVGPDGHPVTGRVSFSITSAAAMAPPDTIDDPAAVPPSSTISEPSPPIADVDDSFGEFSTPSAARWVLRYASYLAIMAVAGILLTGALVWPGADADPVLRLIVGRALAATALLASVQLLVIASDIGGEPPWLALGSIDQAMNTNAGMAFAIRIALAIAMWLLLFRYPDAHPDVLRNAVSIAGLGLLTTWAFAGHAASMRWPTLGVIADVAHHAAAAVWIGGLAIVGWLVIPTSEPAEVVSVMRRFSRVAATSVAVLVATGVAQSIRLVGHPANLLDSGHSRYLAIKLALLAAMLWLANLNRRRVGRQLDDPDTLRRNVGPLRHAMVAELAIGLLIVAVTAAMVVAPPAVGDDATATPSFALYYTL